MNRHACLLMSLWLCCSAASAAAPAQAQAPLTGRMLGSTEGVPPAPPPPGAAATPAAPVVPPAPYRHRPEIGDATRSLLQLQASGRQAAPALPILGDQADASYRRYLRSFEHEIPEFFKTGVERDSASAD